MEPSKRARPNSPQKGLYEAEDDHDYYHRQRRESGDDEHDIDYADLTFSYLKPQTNEVVGGISLKDLCEGKEVVFRMNERCLKSDEEGKDEQEDDIDEEEEELETEEKEFVSNFQRDEIIKLRQQQPTLFLNESFESLASKMTSVTNDDGVKKQVIVEGIGDVIPENSFVRVHYNLFKESSEKPFDSTYLRNRPERINLGQNDLILGLEIAMKTMKEKEVSRFFIHWKYAFGALGCPVRIEPKCNIIADITLLNFQEIDVSGLEGDGLSWFERSIVQVKLEQTNANECFSEGKIKQAVGKYKSSIRTINNLSFANFKEERTALDLKVKSLVNLAICYNKLACYELSCVMCQEALSISPRNQKALFHYARASIALSNFSKARSLLSKLNKMNPNNQDIIEEFRKLEMKKELYSMTSREFWKKAFMRTPDKEEQGTNVQVSNSPGKMSKGDCKDGSKEEEELSKKLQQDVNLNADGEAESWE